MNIEKLMSGIAVVIDDAFQESGMENDDIFKLVEKIEKEWDIPFYKTHEIPSDDVCNNLLQSASFILLDWQLWPDHTQPSLENSRIQDNIGFLKKAKSHFVPVFIFTNEYPSDVADKLPSGLYNQKAPEKNFIFVKGKSELLSEGISPPIKSWLEKNASVYTLKVWEQEFHKAKDSLFSSMYANSPDWPKVFWKSYEDDSVDPGLSIMNLINQSLLGRIGTGDFKQEVLSGGFDSVSREEVQQVMEGASFIQQKQLSEQEIRAGDLFKSDEYEYLLNIRPDCDCTSRDGSEGIGNIELYCLRGKELTNVKKPKIKDKYSKKLGNFTETIGEAIQFPVVEGKTIRFDFKEIIIKKFSEVKNQRIGRLIHPHITRIQQRYALYLQRQGLPRIPKKAVIDNADDT